MSDWVCSVVFEGEGTGISGGLWSLVALRTDSGEDQGHWWSVRYDRDSSREGMAVCRAMPADEVARIEVRSALPFETAAILYGLDPDVFGSQTLWGSAPVRSNGDDGWTWSLRGQSGSFPFMPRDRR